MAFRIQQLSTTVWPYWAEPHQQRFQRSHDFSFMILHWRLRTEKTSQRRAVRVFMCVRLSVHYMLSLKCFMNLKHWGENKHSGNLSTNHSVSMLDRWSTNGRLERSKIKARLLALKQRVWMSKLDFIITWLWYRHRQRKFQFSKYNNFSTACLMRGPSDTARERGSIMVACVS